MVAVVEPSQRTWRGTNLARIGDFNEAVLVDAIRRSREGLSRVDLAGITGLSAQTISNISRRMIDSGLVVEGERLKTGVGKPRTLLRLDPRGAYALGVHLDPQVTTSVLLDMHGQVVEHARHDTPAAAAPDQVIQEVAATVADLVRTAGVDPDRLGVTGASAGGHLSLLLATRGGPGPAEALDAVGRASSAVQAVAIFFPVTDLLNLGRSTENAGDGGPPKSYVRAFGPDATNLPAWRIIGRDLSPIYHIPTNLPPVLILQGTADTLTPAEQSEWFQARARELGRQVEIRHVRGGGHGWLTMFWDLRQFADWFDAHLRRDQSSARTGRE